MRRLIAPIFLSVFLMYTFSQVVIMLNYVINYEYISEVLCENKDKPELDCHGKCHLEKELKKDEQRKTDETRAINEIALYLSFHTVEAVLKTIPAERENDVFLYQSEHSNEHIHSVFHPPCSIA